MGEVSFSGNGSQPDENMYALFIPQGDSLVSLGGVIKLQEQLELLQGLLGEFEKDRGPRFFGSDIVLDGMFSEPGDLDLPEFEGNNDEDFQDVSGNTVEFPGNPDFIACEDGDVFPNFEDGESIDKYSARHKKNLLECIEKIQLLISNSRKLYGSISSEMETSALAINAVLNKSG